MLSALWLGISYCLLFWFSRPTCSTITGKTLEPSSPSLMQTWLSQHRYPSLSLFSQCILEGRTGFQWWNWWLLCLMWIWQPPNFNFYDASKPTFTSPRYLPPTKIERCRVSVNPFPDFCTISKVEQWKRFGKLSVQYPLPMIVQVLKLNNRIWKIWSSIVLQVQNSIISHGCFLRDCSVKHSVIGVRSRLERGVQLEVYRVKQRKSKPLLASLILYYSYSCWHEPYPVCCSALSSRTDWALCSSDLGRVGVNLQDTLMMGADSYETEEEMASLLAEGKIPLGVGENTRIRYLSCKSLCLLEWISGTTLSLFWFCFRCIMQSACSFSGYLRHSMSLICF